MKRNEAPIVDVATEELDVKQVSPVKLQEHAGASLSAGG